MTTTTTRSTGKPGGDDDDNKMKKDNGQNPLQAPDIGAMGGDYSSPPDISIPGEDDHPDSSRL
jgi:hypothetical protein